MRCSKAQRQIGLKLDHELKQSRARVLDLHLAQCDACQAYQEQEQKLHAILRIGSREEFPSWLHHQILDQAARHDRKRVSYKKRWKLQTIPALLAVIVSLSLGALIGKNAYGSVNPLPQNSTATAVTVSDDARQVASFGETSLLDNNYTGGEIQ